MRTTELSDILRTVKEVRDKLGFDVPDHLLEAVVNAEADNPEDEGAARSQIEKAVSEALGRKAS